MQSVSSFAPIAIFAFNRPDHLQHTLRSLTACEGFADSAVTIFCDGPRNDADILEVDATRTVAKAELGHIADIRLAKKNRGLALSIIDGVTELVEKYGRVIVVEDDFDLAPGFLSYMNQALNQFSETSDVYQISGHMFDVPEFAGRTEALFLPITTTWGWGTWHRAWQAFDADATGWERLKTDRRLRRRFNVGGVYDYAAMMERQMAGKADSWGIRWYWSVFQQNGKTLFPPQSLVRNNGQDGSGTHGKGIFASFSVPSNRPLAPAPALPKRLTIEEEEYCLVQSAIWRQNGGWIGWIINKVKLFVGRIVR